MHWYDPEVGHAPVFLTEGCTQDPIVYPAPVSGLFLHYLLYGALPGWKTSTGVACPIHAGDAQSPQIAGDDFTAWKMVSVRQPTGAEAPTAAFYDLPSLRSATELVLKVPRVGFFSTPAFFANWQTNTSNQMRVTMNQALIVATGEQVDGTDQTMPGATPGLDTDARVADRVPALPPDARSRRGRSCPRRTRGTTTPRSIPCSPASPDSSRSKA